VLALDPQSAAGAAHVARRQPEHFALARARLGEDQAIQLVVTGKRARVSVNASQASASGSSAMTSVQSAPAPDRGFWTTWRRIGAAVAGVAGIGAAVFGAIQAF
jgi:hypothetical protein